jgi:hypothetical protein
MHCGSEWTADSPWQLAFAGASAVKLTVTHGTEHADSQLINAMPGGWPGILFNLESLLEAGTVVSKPNPASA